MKRHLLVLLILFNLYSIETYSQELNLAKIDSLKKELSNTRTTKERAKLYHNLCVTFVDTHQDSAIKYGNKALKAYKKTTISDEVLIDINYQLGIAYLDISLQKSSFFLRKSLNKSITIANDSLKNLNYTALSAYYSRLPDVDSSTYYIVLATEYFKQKNDSITLAYCYFSIMNNYNIVRNTKKTIEYGKLSLKIAKNKKIDQLIGPVTIAIAHTYYGIKGENELAKKYVREAEDIAIKSNNKPLLLQVYLTKGINEYNNNLFADCIKTYKKALEISVAIHDDFYISTCNFQLGLANYKLRNNEAAINYFEKSIDLKRSSPKILKSSYFYLAMAYAVVNKSTQDFYLAKYDSITSVENKVETEELLLKYEASEREQEITKLKTKEVEDDLIIQKSKFRIILIISILMLTVLVFTFFIFRYLNRQKILTQAVEIEKHKTQQTKLELKQEKRELASKIDTIKEKIEVIEALKIEFKKNAENESYTNDIVSSLEQKYVSDKHWDNIIHHFNTLHKEYILNLKKEGNNITRNDIKLSILMELGYENTGMAKILNISLEGVKKAKQRLKKKMI